MSKRTKFLLTEKSIPKAWYNIQADLPQPLPPVIHPGTGEPIGPDSDGSNPHPVLARRLEAKGQFFQAIDVGKPAPTRRPRAAA